MICIKCTRELEPVIKDEPDSLQPYGGTRFDTFGHYGSTSFDPMNDLQRIVLFVCDPCLIALAYDEKIYHMESDNVSHWSPDERTAQWVHEQANH